MLIQADLKLLKTPPTKVVSAGEPLNAEVIDQVQRAWGQTIRDGFGQTETTVQVANTPGQPVTIGAMGQPLPGYDVVLVDPNTGEEADDGELCLRLDPRPVGLMKSYYGDAAKTAEAFRGGYYHTGDMARRDKHGIITYVGRDDDVFKSSDYRLSPFELESVLLEHPAVAEAAVVPSPDALKLSVPKAYVVLVAGLEPGPELAEDILRYCREHLAPVQADPAAGIRGAAQDHLGQDPPGGAAAPRGTPARRGPAPRRCRASRTAPASSTPRRISPG